ncbi:MAG: hypothetical protein ACOYLQ_09545 [Hyphomicrobiaceae bacterium]
MIAAAVAVSRGDTAEVSRQVQIFNASARADLSHLKAAASARLGLRRA